MTECQNSILKYKAINGLDIHLLQNDIFECPLLLNLTDFAVEIEFMIERVEKSILNITFSIINPIFIKFHSDFENLINDFSNEIINKSAVEVNCEGTFNDCFLLQFNNKTSTNLHNFSEINATCLYNDKFQSLTSYFLNNYNDSSHLKEGINSSISHIKIFFDTQVKFIEYSGMNK